MRKAVVALSFLAVAACSGEGLVSRFDARVAERLDEVLRDAVERGDVPGMVALVTADDTVLYRGAFGVMDAGGEAPMQPDALFFIASMTKPITSLGVMMLVEDGKLHLDEPASSYLPELDNREVLVEIDSGDSTVTTRQASRPVTVRDLLRHTSGLGYTFANPRLLEWTRITGRADLEQPLLHDPGTEWTYGTNTYFLGRIIEEVTGEGLPEFFRSRILGPLGMTDTSFDLAEGEDHRLAALYRRSNGELRGRSQAQPYRRQVRGDYGLLSTADDYAGFMRLILGDGETDGVRLLSPEGVAEMTRDQLQGISVIEQPGAIPGLSRAFPLGAGQDGFGLGFQVAAAETEGRAAGSLSWAGLYNTHFWIDPANGLGVVLLVQLLPFYDEAAIRLLTEFERTLYEALEDPS